jgi:hypothetical protein
MLTPWPTASFPNRRPPVTFNLGGDIGNSFSETFDCRQPLLSAESL